MALYNVTNIKISKFDINGNDNTSNLEQLLYFTLKYSDINPVQFNILDRKEYSDYFLFTVRTIPYEQTPNIDSLISSSDNNILNYKISSSRASNQSGSIITYDSILTDNLNYLLTSSGEFVLGNTPNIPLTLISTASITSVNGTLGTELRVYKKLSGSNSLLGVSGFSYTQASLAPLGSATLYVSGSFIPVKGERYVIAISDDSPSDTDITASNARLLITQSINPNVGVSGSGDLLIMITPGEDFENPLLNNIENIVPNPHYLTLDYTVNILPENEFQLALSGSGTNSTVKQYNYEANRIILPRYKGSKSVSPDWNLNTIEGGLGVSPNVEKTNIFFAAINQVTETSPEIINSSVVNFKFLIDDQGNTYELNNDPSNISYYNSTFTFEKDKKIIISDNEGTNYTSLIYRSGCDVIPILYSDTGLTFEPTLSFSSTGVGNYLYKASTYNWMPANSNVLLFWGPNSTNESNQEGKSFLMKFPTISKSPDLTITNIQVSASTNNIINNFSTYTPPGYPSYTLTPIMTGSLYHITNTTPDAYVKFKYQGQGDATGIAGLFYLGSTYSKWQINVKFIKAKLSDLGSVSPSGIYTWNYNNISTNTEIIASATYMGNLNNPNSYNETTNPLLTYPNKTVVIDGGNGGYISYGIDLETNFLSLEIDDVVGLLVELIDIPTAKTVGFYNSANPGYNFYSIETISDPPPSLLITTSPQPYFQTASSNPYRLIMSTASINANPSLTSGLAQAFEYKQLDITGSEYKAISKKSLPVVGDQIRFEHNESLSYDILETGFTSSGNFYLDLNNPILDGTNLNWFLIRRYIRNPSKMIINTAFEQTGGFAFPEYMNKNITDNLPKIIEKLKIENLI